VHGHAISPPRAERAPESAPATLDPSHPVALLRALGLRARKGLSQSFLVDPAIARAAAAAAELTPADTVVEPGPGLGLLTRELVKRAGRVIAVELDPALATALPRIVPAENLEVVQGDILQFDPAAYNLERYLLVSNLPYQITSPVLTRFLVDVPPPVRMVLMLQREVAEKLLARPGSFSFLSVQTQLLATARLVRHVPPGAFSPRPRVLSTLVRLDTRPAAAVPGGDVRAFLAFVRAGFAQPRKQLRNSLAQGLNEPPARVDALLAATAIPPTRRPQELTLDDWRFLYAAYLARRPAS